MLKKTMNPNTLYSMITKLISKLSKNLLEEELMNLKNSIKFSLIMKMRKSPKTYSKDLLMMKIFLPKLEKLHKLPLNN